ncbi:MAG: carbohydrate ABC transporter permease [Peptococcaceae bacterium]|nr:carbohydrate ABC transporter permease [Peptococcaceae bacterium]
MRAKYISLSFLGFIFMFPLLVTFTNSFMSEVEIAMNYSTNLSIFDVVNGVTQKFIVFVLIPASITLAQYKAVLFAQPVFMTLLLNSMKITLPVVLGNVAVSLLCAYAFTIWRWKHKEKVFFVYIIVMLMPLQAVLVPNYIIADWLSIKDNYLAIILPGIFSPFGVFLLRQSMKAIPKEYFEAAKIDGASDWHIFWYVVLPQMKAGIAALSMLVFIEYWNLVEQAIVFIKDYYREPLSIFLSRIAEGQIALVFAASCVFMFLPLWFLAVGQKNLEKGIELTGVK